MQVGDLVRDRQTRALKCHNDWLGLIITFDIDQDPVVQWFLLGKAIPRIQSEFRKDVYII